MAPSKIAAAPLELPDHVIHGILCRLPAKSVVGISFLSQQWENVLFSLPDLDFDEGGDTFYKHNKFVNVLKRCLSIFENEKQKQPELGKFRICMTNYLCEDAIVVSAWLRYSLSRSVKDISISLRGAEKLQRVGNLCWLSMLNFVNGDKSSMVSLNLEFVVLNSTGQQHRHDENARLFPSLKKMSFENVYFDRNALYYLMKECPAVESLSFTSCTFESRGIVVVSSSLQSVVINNCIAYVVLMKSASKLKSVTVVSNACLRELDLSECYNLKHIDVYGNFRLKVFHVDGCNEVKGTIHAPSLNSFSYEGYMNSSFCLKAPRLIRALIILWENWGGEASFNPTDHFSKLHKFLKMVGNSKEVKIMVSDFKTLIFPENFRRTAPKLILPNVKSLAYATTTVVATGIDEERLIESLRWMAPSARDVYQLEYDAELDMYMEPY